VRRVLLLALVALSAGPPLACAQSGFVLTILQEDGDEGTGGRGNGGAPTGSATGGDAGNEGGSYANVPADCPAFETGVEVKVCAAGNVSTAGDDTFAALAMSSSGRLIAAGELGGSLPGVPVSAYESAVGPGALVVLSNAGRSLERVVWLPATPTAVEADVPRKRLVVAAGTRISAMTDDTFARVWDVDTEATIERVDVAPSGHVAALTSAATVVLIDPDGQQNGAFGIADDQMLSPTANDVALSASGDVIYVTGSRTGPPGGCSGQIPFLRAYDAGGQVKARAYDFASIGESCASTVGRRVTLGRDGYIYYGGHNHGGNTVHLFDPHDITNPAPLVAYDLFNQGYGKAILKYGFVARFSGSDLRMLSGHFLLPRSEEEIGGELLIDELASDEDGQLIVSARSTCCMPDRAKIRVAGQAIGPYVNPELVVVALSSDFLIRRTWFSPTLRSAGVVEPRGMIWAGGLVAVLGESSPDTDLVTHQPSQPGPLGGQDGYLLTFQGPK